MIAYLKGRVIFKGDDFLVLDVGGVGYRVFADQGFLSKIKRKSLLELFIYAYQKRDGVDLYGFPSRQGLELFETLIAIPGAGPKTARVLVGFGSLKKLQEGMKKPDEQFLIRTKGIGKKKLQRIALELTGKVKSLPTSQKRTEDEALVALCSLGFSKQEAERALDQVSSKIKSEERIKEALKRLGRKP